MTHSLHQSELLSRLEAGLDQLELSFTADQKRQLIDFVGLLSKWNKVYNLTAVRSPLMMIGRHLLDSLTLLPYIEGQQILDVGCGAGLPGLPLAIALPQKTFVLLDSNAKKTRFIRQAVIELGLDNVDIVCVRIEQFQSEPEFDMVVSRAFTDMSRFYELTRDYLKPGGHILGMKGVNMASELDALTGSYRVEVFSVNVPGEDKERNLVRLST